MSIQVENPGNWLKLGVLPSGIGSVTLEFLFFSEEGGHECDTPTFKSRLKFLEAVEQFQVSSPKRS